MSMRLGHRSVVNARVGACEIGLPVGPRTELSVILSWYEPLILLILLAVFCNQHIRDSIQFGVTHRCVQGAANDLDHQASVDWRPIRNLHGERPR